MSLKDQVIAALKTVYDPEMPVNIYELGLIYEAAADEEGRVAIRMTLTSPACPVAEELPPAVEQKVAAVPGVTSVAVDVVWEPPWDPDRMSDEARRQLDGGWPR